MSCGVAMQKSKPAYIVGRASDVFDDFMQPSRYKALFGGRGCVHADTLIDTPSGPVPISDFNGGPVYTERNGHVGITYATRPKEYFEVDLYEVTFSDGRRVVCTDQHKFKTARGWATLADLTTSDVFCAVPRQGLSFRLRSSLDTSLQGLLAGVRRSTEKLAGFLGYCSDGCRQYGQPLPSLSGIARGGLPSQGDVQLHSRRALICLGGRESGHSCNHSPPSRPLASRAAVRASADVCCEGAGSHSDGKSSVLPLASCRQSLLFPLRTYLARLIRKQSELGLALGTLKHQARSLQRLSRKHWRVVFGNPYQGLSVGGGEIPTIVRLRQVIKHSRQTFWDVHVPETNCYFAHGVLHHNSAKSHFFAEAMIANAAENSGFRAACIREVQKTLKESAKRLLEDKIAEMGYSDRFRILNDQIICPGNGVIIFQGMQDHTAESIKSLEGFQIAWVEESQTLSSRSLELLRPTIRATGSELWFSWNPRNRADAVDAFFRGPMPPEDAIIREINFTDNKLFPAELEADRLHDHKANPDRYAHIWHGDYEPEALGAIWTRQVIEANRVVEPPAIERILVGIDPAVTDTAVSDEHGVSVCALGSDGHGYVLEDASLKGGPVQWAQRALAMYDKYEADAIVVEINQGGDMVKHTIESQGRGARIIEVRATRGKHVRAEPVSALYSTNRIHHVGSMPEMEDQLCKFTSSGYEGSDSPDRAEAMIWCMTELFPGITRVKSKEETFTHVGGGSAWMG